MQKLKLEIENLVVESFDTDSAGTDRGTVEGRDASMGHCNTYLADCTMIAGCTGYTCAAYSCPALSCDDCGSYRCAGTGEPTSIYLDVGCI